VPGWYGKLPSLGDFASRRLDPVFIEVWDQWLAAGMADWREREPASWLDEYLTGPSWRFLLMPGLLSPGGGAWVGVLMPSVDKVGRYFPLTLAQPLPFLSYSASQARALLGWLQRLDDLAVAALQDDWTVDQLEVELARLGSWQQTPQQTLEQTLGLASLPSFELFSQTTVALGTGGDVVTLLENAAREQLLHNLRAKALWLRSDSLGDPVLRMTMGLPRGADFSGLLTSGIPRTTDSSSHHST